MGPWVHADSSKADHSPGTEPNVAIGILLFMGLKPWDYSGYDLLRRNTLPYQFGKWWENPFTRSKHVESKQGWMTSSEVVGKGVTKHQANAK